LLQESYFTYDNNASPVVDSNIHFRAGIGTDGNETFTPRTVIYDLKGGFGSLRKINALYDLQDEQTPTSLWDGSTSTQQQQLIEPSRYQTLLDQGLPTYQLRASDVKYWSDFNRVFYHPRSAIQLNEYELNSQLMPFENWSAGEDLFRDLDREFDLLDRDVRPFAEECDQLQGIQMLTSTDDAWGGFAARYMDSLRDEYGKTSIWVWGSENTTRLPRQETILRASNTALSMSAFGQQASAYIRMATAPTARPSYLNMSSTSEWMTSALQCVAFESVTLPGRLMQDSANIISLSFLESVLNTNGSQNIHDLQFSQAPEPAVNGSHVVSGEDDELHEGSHVSQLDISLTPGVTESNNSGHVFSQTEVARTRYQDSQASSALPDDRSRQRQNDETIVEKFKTRLTFPLLDSFPESLFRSRVPRQLEVVAALRCSSSMKNRILQLRDMSRMALSSDDRENIYNDLSGLANNYNFGWDEDLDTDEDD
jgi:hypothetical protein